MIKSSLRCRVLPLSAWRALFLVAAMAVPFRSPIVRAVPSESVPAKASASATAKGKKNDAKKLTAPALIAEVEKGIALIGKGAKDAKIDPKSKTAAPFFAALKTVAKNAGTLKKQLAAKDGAYFKTLSESAGAVGKLRVTAPRIGVANKEINDGAKVVFDSFDALRANFGKEAARKKAGGPLTDKEKATFAKLKEQQSGLVAKLAPVREKAVKSGNKKLVRDLDGLFKQSRTIASAKDDVNGFVLALELFDYLAGEYAAYTYYVPAEYRTDWVYVDTSFRDADTIYWEYYDSYPVSDWAYYETASISYEYDYAWDASITETEVSEYNSYVEESSYDEASYEETSDEAYIDEASYEESYAENEDEQDSSWEDTEDDIVDDADEADDDSGDDADDSSDDADDSSDDADDSSDDADDSGDDADDSSDDADDSSDDADDGGDDADDSSDDADDGGDDADDGGDDADDSGDDADDSGDDADDGGDDADDGGDDSDDGGGDDGGDDQ